MAMQEGADRPMLAPQHSFKNGNPVGAQWTCQRIAAIGVSLVLMILGAAILGLLLLHYYGADIVTIFVENQLYQVAVYLLTAGGGAMLLVGLLGLLGGILQIKPLLLIYLIGLQVLLVVTCVVVALTFTFRSGITSHVNQRMRDTLTDQYGIATRTNEENRKITKAWDTIQSQFHCCGISGNETSTNSWVYYSTNTLWYIEIIKKSGANLQKVPTSCCKPGDNALCTGSVYFPGPPNHFSSPKKKFNKANPYLYTTGCYDKLMSYIMERSLMFGILSAVVPVILLLGIIVTVFFLCSKRKTEYVV